LKTKILHPEDDRVFLQKHPIAGSLLLPSGFGGSEIVPVQAREEIWWLIPRDTSVQKIRDLRSLIAGDCTFVTVARPHFLELQNRYYLGKPRLQHSPNLKDFFTGHWPTALSPEYEAKRRTIQKAHNWAIFAWILILFSGPMGLLMILRQFGWGAHYGIVAAVQLLGIAAFVLFIHHFDLWLCRKCDFFCPRCQKSLYFDPRITSGSLLAGICPRCKKTIEANPPVTP